MAQLPGQPFGAFIPTTSIWDVGPIYQAKLEPELQEILVRLYQNLNTMAISSNVKISGYYDTNEFVSGKQFFPNPANNSTTPVMPDTRPGFTITVNFGALPDSDIKSIPHGITTTPGFSCINIYGAATNPTIPEYVSLPYASATTDNIIEMYADGTNVNVITTADYSSYTVCYIVFEYIKN